MDRKTICCLSVVQSGWVWIKDVDDLDGLCNNVDEAKSAIERFDQAVDAKVQALTGPWIQQAKEIDAAKIKATGPA